MKARIIVRTGMYLCRYLYYLIFQVIYHIVLFVGNQYSIHILTDSYEIVLSINNVLLQTVYVSNIYIDTRQLYIIRYCIYTCNNSYKYTYLRVTGVTVMQACNFFKISSYRHMSLYLQDKYCKNSYRQVQGIHRYTHTMYLQLKMCLHFLFTDRTK